MAKEQKMKKTFNTQRPTYSAESAEIAQSNSSGKSNPAAILAICWRKSLAPPEAGWRTQCAFILSSSS